MAKIVSTGKQFMLTIPKDLIELMGWDSDTEVIITKYPEKDLLYIEKIRRK
jgi:hypothetical protein